MLGKILILTERCLRLDARLLRTHLLRVGVVGLLVFWLFFIHLDSLLFGAPGLDFLEAITYLGFIFSTLAGGTLFATTITEEKEEQTLGLLTLANIQPSALILGKFLPRLVNVLLLISAAFPFTLLSITLGGVTWSQVWAAYWTLLAHIVLMGSIGLMFSVICRRSGWAITLTFLSLLLFFAVPPTLLQVVGALGSVRTHAAIDVVERVSESGVSAGALVRIGEIMQTGFDQGAFGWQVNSNLVAGAVLCLVAWGLYPLFNRSEQSATQSIGVLQRGLRFSRASRRAWTNALIWKDFYYLSGGPTLWLVRVLVFGPIVFVIAVIANNFVFDASLRVTFGETLMGTMIYFVLPIELTVVAARLFRSEIKDGTWSSLVALPISVGRIAYAKACGGVLGIVPALGYFLLGAVLAIDSVVAVFADWTGLVVILMLGYYSAFFLIYLHLTTLYSILLNAWAGPLLALVTIIVSSCFMSAILFLPMMIISGAGSALGGEVVGVAIAMGLYGAVFFGICFGLQVLIADRLRVAAGR